MGPPTGDPPLREGPLSSFLNWRDPPGGREAYSASKTKWNKKILHFFDPLVLLTSATDHGYGMSMIRYPPSATVR